MSRRRRHPVAGVVAAALVLSNGCVVGTPPWVAPGLRVVYRAEGAGRAGIRFLVAREENEIALTRDPNDEAPAYDRVSGWVYFSSRQGGSWDLHRVRLSGFDRTPITRTPGVNERWPKLAADGRTLFYTSDVEGSAQIFRSDPEGANAARVTEGPSPHSRPAVVDSLGTRLVALAGEEKETQLVSIELASGGAARVQPLAGTSGLPPAGGPAARTDGTVLYPCRGQEGIDICRLDPGKGARRITEGAAEDRDPAWSADGKRILFSSNRSDGNFELYLMDEDGSDVRRLTEEPGPDREPYWVP